MEDLIISVSLTLFMLNLITEQVSSFIKLHFPSVFGKSENVVAGSKWERKILSLSALVGIGVAIVCNADFFTLIAEKGTVQPFTQITLKGLLGCVITGLFLGQGSKFFHDLLHTVMYYKNMKKAISNKQELENVLLEANNSKVMLDLGITADQREDDEDVNH